MTIDLKQKILFRNFYSDENGIFTATLNATVNYYC